MKKLSVLLALVGMAAMFVTGCATTAKGPSDEELISQRIQEGLAALKAKNFDEFDGMVSESFYSGAVGDKKDLLAYLKNADDSGFLDNLEVDLANAKTTVDGEKATVAPVVATGGFGTLTLNFDGIKEKGKWVISGLEPGY